MRVSDKFLNCVFFIGFENKKKEIRFIGTAFIMGDESNLGYLVTAKHVIAGIKEQSVDGKVLIRVNLFDGSIDILETHSSEWLSSDEDPFADVSIFSWDKRKYGAIEYLLYPVAETFPGNEISGLGPNPQKIGLGDDVFIVGLFVSHFGRKRNIPVIRMGNIAMMPEEPVSTQKYGDIEAYLIETRSTGGLSGSPVFVRDALPVSMPRLIGLVHGHWDSKTIEVESDSVVLDPSGEPINMGMAIVVPSSKIIDLINCSTLKELRKNSKLDKGLK